VGEPAAAPLSPRAAIRWAALYFAAVAALALWRDRDLYARASGAPARLMAEVAYTLLQPTLWAALLVITFGISRRSWATRAPGVLLVAGVTLAYHAVHQGAAAWLRHLVGASPVAARRIAGDLLLLYPSSVAVILALLIAGATVTRMVRLREAEAREARLAADLTALRGAALLGQLRPHFFFNTLQAIATLLHRDAPAARAMLARLRCLLESSLAPDPRPTIPLVEEVALVALYTDIETVRFRDRLRVERRIDAAAERALVPRFLLQPLVENAITHAVAVRGEGVVTISAGVRDGAGLLELSVSDTGAGANGVRAPGAGGMGLAYTRGRLAAHYGTRFEVALERGPAGETTVRLVIPLEEAPYAPSSSSAQRA
jgi:two-component system, LytTR family, sensor kinase